MSTDIQLAQDHRTQVEALGRPPRTELVTLVFTDIVGSTALKQQLGNKAGVAPCYGGQFHATDSGFIKL